MKHVYILILLLFSVNLITAQDEQLLGEWTLNSIFDFDILLENPANPINITFSNTTNTVTIDSFCGNTYESFYTPSTTENSIHISQTSWNFNECSEDNQGWEVAIANLLSNTNITPKTVTYTITEDENTEVLELSFSYIFEGTPTGTTGYFSRQNPPEDELIGQWYLNFIEVDDVIHDNYYNEQGSVDIVFSTISTSPTSFNYSGVSSCNEYGGGYSANSNSITFNELNVTLEDCIGTPRGIFEELYIAVLGGNLTLPNQLDYLIIGSGDNQTLTITNPTSGDSAVYGRLINTDILVKTWYLSRIEFPGNPSINIPISETPTLTLTNTVDPVLFYTQAIGNGECNDFECKYETILNNGNSIKIQQFGATLLGCSFSSYEFEYFSTLETEASNYFDFEIINNGTVLRLTDLLGVTLVFGDAPLSITDSHSQILDIRLNENPVTSFLKFTISKEIENSLNYKLYNFDGKLITKATLQSDEVDVENLASGLYFIRFFNGYTLTETIKFIKL